MSLLKMQKINIVDSLKNKWKLDERAKDIWFIRWGLKIISLNILIYSCFKSFEHSDYQRQPKR